MIVSVDIGGSKTRIGAYERSGSALTLIREARYPTEPTRDVIHHLKDFLAPESAPPQAISLAVAGPVVSERVRLTNVPWILDGAQIRAKFSCPHVFLINDLEAHGFGLEDVAAENVVTLQEGKVQPGGNRALIAAGAGLGECLLFEAGTHYLAKPSEGGHTDFAPSTEEEIDLLRYLMSRYGHVSWERVVSGKLGFRNLFEFLRDSGRADVPASLATKLDGLEHIGPLLIEAAQSGVAVARRVIKLFVRLYGAEAGNLALAAMASGGLFIAGGVAPGLLPWMREGEFLEAFRSKGRMASLMSQIPVRLVVDQYLPLRGAAKFASIQME